MKTVAILKVFSYKRIRRRGFLNTVEVIISAIIILIVSVALVQLAVLSPNQTSSQQPNTALESLAYDTLQTGINLGTFRALAYSNPLNTSLQTQATIICTITLPATISYVLNEHTADGSPHPFNGRILLGISPPNSYHGQRITVQSFVDGFLAPDHFQQVSMILSLTVYGGSLAGNGS